jgi:hypothetical protein
MKRHKTKVSGGALERFIRKWGLSKRQAADYLGTSPRMIYFYIAGTYPMSQTIGLLIKALDENWTMKRDMGK